MKYLKTICLLILAITFLWSGWWVGFRYLPSKQGARLNQSELKSNINAIARKYTNLYAKCEIWDESDKLRFKNDNIEIINHINKSQRMISISGGEEFERIMDPIQVYGIFESWLFVRDKKLPYDVIVICWSYTSGGMDNTLGQTTIITLPEYEEIYNSTDTKGLTREQAAKVLADKWIQKTGYIKK